jgi:hypothetical protein
MPPFAEWVLYKTSSAQAPDLSDLKVKVVGPGQSFSREQRDFLHRHIPALRLWRFLRYHRQGKGWIFFASSGERLCHYNFVTPARAYRRMFPEMEPGGQMIGPALTDVDALYEAISAAKASGKRNAVQGRALHARVLCHIVNTLGAQGLGPFYGYVDTSNLVSMRGVEKAGFVRCGVWRGKRYFLDLRVVSRRIGD